jgi:hypothetical protein
MYLIILMFFWLSSRLSLASRIATTMPDASGAEAIQIILVRGYDIGIFSSWMTKGYSFSPAQLRGASSASGQ